MKSTRGLAVLIGLLALAVAPRMASSGCTTTCDSWSSSTGAICSSCCKFCINDQGVVTYDACNTRCITV